LSSLQDITCDAAVDGNARFAIIIDARQHSRLPFLVRRMSEPFIGCHKQGNENEKD
jgi:hypothetical protein